ncbi:MAG: hypothetical protein AB7O96_12505 [Pseudobdellovibrionaceae bacterium]
MKRVLLFFLLAFVNKAWSFPETIRHGYVNCMACHTTSQGGDLLSLYGRELSKEIFSRKDSIFKTSQTEKNYWEVETPEWLNVGGDVRLLQTFSESSVASKGRFMVMQVDLDGVAKLGENLQFYGSVGRYEPTAANSEWQDFIYTPRAWIQYSHSDGAKFMALRVGRFFPTYGINIPEHTYVTRRYLDFNPGQERLSAEISWSNENYQFVATALSKRATFERYDPERGYVLQLSKVFGKNARIGVNLYRSKLTQSGVEQNKAFEGVYALVGLAPEWSMLVQVDRIYYPHGKTGVDDLLKFSYEYTQGLQFFFTQEYYNKDTVKTDPHVEAFGVGAEYFPAPNVELVATYRQYKDSSQLNELQKQVWLIAHLYF